MNGSDNPPAAKLIVKTGPFPGQEYDLLLPEILIGRDPASHLVIDVASVSRRHARLVSSGDGYLLEDLESGNGTFLNGQRLNGTMRLKPGDQIGLGKAITLMFVRQAPATVMESISHVAMPEVAPKHPQEIRLGEKAKLRLGRDASNEIVLDSPTVSRFHAEVERVGERYCLRDLHSANGTFVSDRRITGDVWLSPQDTIRIGPYRLVVSPQHLTRYDETDGLQVDAVRLNKWVRSDLNILQDISLVFHPREFVVVVGQSGGGKSTLVDAIAGYRPASHGRVLVNGIDIYQNFDAVRQQIGYVPQKDIIHTELTVFQAIDYAAQLRMPPDTSREERHKRVMEVLHDLDLVHRKDVQISGLSGGQQKRVSIGVELLTKPGLFFLDEPTSGLDPASETALMRLMRQLADQGRTIVMITHATKNVSMADKIVFLARGGFLAWFGPPDEAIDYFNAYRPKHEQGAGKMEFDEIYDMLDNSRLGRAEDWAKRYREHPAYQKYIVQGLKNHIHAPQAKVQQKPQRQGQRQVSAFRQFLILSARNLNILTRDRFSLILILAAAPLISLIDVLLGFLLGHNPFDYQTGNMRFVVISLFQMTMYGILVSGLAQMREFVKEMDIYRRERLVNLKIAPYVLSKVFVAGLLALVHAGVYVGMHYLVFRMPGGLAEFVLIYISMTLLTFTGMMLGLFASALAPNANAAPLLLILMILPQVILGGVMIPVPRTVSAASTASWAFESFMGITGTGSDVAADVCWAVPGDVYNLMTLENKSAFGCKCMGINLLDPNSCNFPGVGLFASEAVRQPPPVEPARLGDPPPKPDLPPRPAEPANQADNVAVAEYLSQLKFWESQVKQIQTNYEQQVERYQGQARLYQAQLLVYQQDMAKWRIARESVTRAAEELVNQYKKDYGWAFVDKGNPTRFWLRIGRDWLAEIVIASLLFFGILILQKRRDII